MKKILVSVSSSMPKDYENAINLVGGNADSFYLPKCTEVFQKSFLDLLDRFSSEYDGFILSGGGDVNPEIFGEKINDSTRIDDARDEWELQLLNKFMSLGKPIMGICRGHQVMNVALGGTLKQDNGIECNKIHTSTDSVFKTHNTSCKPSFLQELYGTEFIVNSHHHQSLNRVADDLIPIQYSADGCIEGVMHNFYPYIGVQWHPERLCKPNAKESGCVDGTLLFEYFLSLDKKGDVA